MPIFVWAVLATTALLTLATPTLVVAGLFGILDRTAETAFFVNEHGGSSFLWQNLFWFFGHPEVYIMALPGFGIVMEIMPVFTRKPLFAYKVAAAGMLGVALLSFFVWQHHLFQSGINPDMRPLFMLTTELISIPTGFLFLVTLGTLWKAKIRFDTPMLFCLGMLFNFLIGGVTGVFLSDVPVNVTVHGSFFVLAHFHYTIMGGLIFALFAGFYYWFPKITGKTHEPQAEQVALLDVLHLLQPHVLPTVPRRASSASPAGSSSTREPADAERHLEHQRLPPRRVVLLLHHQLHLVDLPDTRTRRRPTRGTPSGLEWQTPTPVPWFNFEHIPVVLNDPYHYGEPDAAPVADLGRPCPPSAHRRDRSATTNSEPAWRATAIPGPRYSEARSHDTERRQPAVRELPPAQARRPRRSPSSCGRRRGRCGREAGSSSGSGPSPSPRWRSPTSTSARPTTRISGVPAGITAPTGGRRGHLRHHRGGRAVGPVRRAALPQQRDAGLAGGRLDRRPRRAARHRPPDLAADRASLLPGSSGYASCFIGWAAMNIAVLLAGTYWIETILAREIRLRRAMAQDGGAPDSTLPVARLFRANLNGCTYFWGFIAHRRDVLLGTLLCHLSREG